MSTSIPLVYTIINGNLNAITPRAFEIANEIRARRNIPLLEPIPPEEAASYYAQEEADTLPLCQPAPALAEPAPPENSLLATAICVAIMLLLVLIFFAASLYRAEHLSHASTILDWMGHYRAVMMPIECLGALIWGILS